MMGTFSPIRHGREDETTTIWDNYDGVSSFTSSRDNPTSSSSSSSSCFERSDSLGNDYCPHSSQLYPLMEAEDELPVQPLSLRKQTAVTCLYTLVETPPDNECINSNDYDSSHGRDFVHRGVFPDMVVTDQSIGDEWGHFAQYWTDDYGGSSNYRVRLPSRRRKPPLQRRRPQAKYDRHGSLMSFAWSG